MECIEDRKGFREWREGVRVVYGLRKVNRGVKSGFKLRGGGPVVCKSWIGEVSEVTLGIKVKQDF